VTSAPLATVGKLLVGLGAVLVVVGCAVWLLSKWRPSGMPGDVVVHRHGWTVYVPIVTMVVLSLLLTIALNVALRLWRR
jgi:uncharacterized membrane protein